MSWWTCIKATSSLPDPHSHIFASHHLSISSPRLAHQASILSPKISGDFIFRFLRYLVSVPPSRPQLSYIGLVWLTVTGFWTYARAPVFAWSVNFSNKEETHRSKAMFALHTFWRFTCETCANTVFVEFQRDLWV